MCGNSGCPRCRSDACPRAYRCSPSQSVCPPMTSIRTFLAPWGSSCTAIADETTARLYGERLGVELITFPGGEAHKTREEKQRIEDLLIQRGCDRTHCLVALGGGIV